MASETAGGSPLTCSACQRTVDQPPGTRRTICPHCGNFYSSAGRVSSGGRPRARPGSTNRPKSRSSASCRTTQRRSGPDVVASSSSIQPLTQTDRRGNTKQTYDLPTLLDDQDKDRPVGRLQTIANFLQNLGPGKRGGKDVKRDQQGDGRSDGRSPASRADTRPASGSLLPPINKDPMTVKRPAAGIVPAPPHAAKPRLDSHTDTQNQDTETYVHHIKNLQILKSEVKSAQNNGLWKDVQNFYLFAFDSFSNINTVFRKENVKPENKSTENSGVELKFALGVFDVLLELPQDIQKGVLKSVINSLLKEKRPHCSDDLRAYFILSLNPQFSAVGTFVIFAHLLRQTAGLSDSDHHYLVHWFKRLETSHMKSLIHRLQNFISLRLFPPKKQEMPPISKCSWWIPSATKVLALINAANNMCVPSLVSYMEFYNYSLEVLDLMSEYYMWQNPATHPGFTFCQYPFILSISAKRSILQRDSEQQMIIMARRSLVAKVQRHQLPEIGMLFLNLTVRRSHLVSDSLNEIALKQHDLKKKLKVTFAGEPGLDMGGLTKEWFLLLVRQIFQPDYGMFTYNKKAGVYWFSTAPCENYQEFNLVGVLMGLAVYNSIILDIRFPACCYKKLLSPAVVPYNNPTATVGVTTHSLNDLNQVFPELAHGLRELLDYEGDVEEDFGLTFQITYQELCVAKTKPLKAGGENCAVSNENRKEYIQLYVDFLLNRSPYYQFQAFYHGFHSVCASNALIMLRPEEVELLVCGNPNLDMTALKKVTVYEGYKSHDSTIHHFWDVVLGMSKDMQKKLLLFTTGSDRIPVGGMSEMQYKITRVDKITMLPVSHTCFNQLILPDYKSNKILKQKLTIAIQNAEGFGLE